MKISDQPGRIFAILLLSPYLIYRGYKIDDKILLIMGILFLIYELFWVLSNCYKVCDV